MDDEDRPGTFAASFTDRSAGAAAQLAREPLDSLSHDELDARIALLEVEIIRVRAHQARVDAHRRAAEAIFGRPSGG